MQARVAGLGGYLLAKAVALRERALEKDYYDFAYVLLFNRLGGPAQAARLLLEGPLAGRLAGLQTVWRELAERFETADRVGPVGYAEQALVVDPTADPARLRQDAAVAVREFLEVLGVV